MVTPKNRHSAILEGLENAGIKLKPRQKRLTDAQIIEALSRYSAGVKLPKIAQDLGISAPALHYHLRQARLAAGGV